MSAGDDHGGGHGGGGDPRGSGGELRPASGARFLLERTGAADAASATYRAAIYTPTTAHAADATLREDGSVDLPPTGAGAVDAALAMFAKLTARAATKRREDGLPAWPARVLRWRPDKG